jgi:fatty acid desaturase
MILRNRHDLRTLAHLAVCWSLNYLALAHSLWWAIPAVMASSMTVAIAHNHFHLPIFRVRVLNRLLDLLLHLTQGIPQVVWQAHHLRRHHVAPQTDLDWSSTYAFREAAPPSRPISWRYYRLTYLPLFLAETLIDVLRRRRRAELTRMLVQAGSFAAVSAALAWAFGPWRWLALFVPTYLTCGTGLGSLNYLQHWACHRADGKHWAWTFTCPIHNFLTYNAGYHMLHHLKPGLHLSEMPAVHQADPSYTPADLVENGLFPGFRGARGTQAWFAAKLEAQNRRLARPFTRTVCMRSKETVRRMVLAG